VPSTPNPEENSSRSLQVTLLLCALVLALTLVRYRPPAPKSADAPSGEFSAGRARQVLNELVGDGAPHPVGSAANARVRERIVAHLTAMGYSPQVQTAFACSHFGTCAEVHNAFARLAGLEPGPAVMLAAHYDSVGAGPGASDDGAGVAALLEIARILRSAPSPRNSIILLIDDGEEGALLGARAFVDEHPWAREVRAAVNLEARGSSGPSLMFETGSASAWLMRIYAASVERPITSSLFYAAYKQLPNDTDFTVFKAAGIQGFNFAYVGDVVHYHTPLDNFADADPGSLQHHGDNALATIRGLANADLRNPPAGEAVFFDLFAWRTVSWPLGWTPRLAGAAAYLVFLVIILLLYRGFLAARAVAWGATVWPVAVAASATLAWGLVRALRAAGALPSPWVAHPLPTLVAFWALGFGVSTLVVAMLARRAGFWGLWAGTWAWWGVVAFATGWRLPEASYLFFIPAGAAGLCGLPAVIGADARWKRHVAGIVPAVVAAVLGLAVARFLYDVMGAPLLAVLAAVIALVSTTLAPVLAASQARWRWGLPLAAVAATICGAVTAILVPAYSVRAPERMNIIYHLDADSGKAQWLVFPASGVLPETLRKAAKFDLRPAAPLPLSGQRGFTAEAAPARLAAPTFSVLEQTPEGARRRVRALLRSSRAAAEAAVLFPASADVQSFTMAGHAVPAPPEGYRRWLGGWSRYACLTLPPEGVEVAFTLPAAASVEAIVLDQSPGLPPPGGALLQQARPPTAVPSQDGDVSLVSRRVRLAP
jgi:hypothetical protein